MPRRRILFLGLNYAPEPVGIGPYTAGLAESLAARGHTVHAVVGQPYYPDWALFDRFHRRWKRSVENGVSITRCPHYIPAHPTGTRRLAHHLSFASAAFPSLRARAAQLQPDLIFTVAPSMVAVPVAKRVARRLGIPLWLHVQDFEVGAALATGLIGQQSRRIAAARSLERRMLGGADIVSTISPAMCAALVDKGVPAGRVIEMRNWANHSEAMQGEDGSALRQRWGLIGKTVVLYSGTMSHKQGLDIVIDAARQLEGRGDLVFVIAGKGPKRAAIERQAADLANVRIEGLQDEAQVGALLRMADIHLLPQIEGAADLVLPSKISNMLASARPIVATVKPDSGIAREVTGCGLLVPPGDANALARAIVSLADNPALREIFGARGAARALERWSKDKVIDVFEAQMQALLG